MVRLTGTEGTLRVGYQTAADLGAWELALLPVLPRAYRCSAVVRGLSEYWLAQAPISLRLEIGGQTWTWTDVTPHLSADGVARITLTLTRAPVVAQTAPAAQEARTVWGRSGR